MTGSIQVLDEKAANQIAAGEVVERPVSVVKELIENALDARAKHIDITIEGSGVPLIRITDDGDGILPEDLPRAVLRHATSKIRQIEDLDDLRTLGFRGEAIPSIASVSKMEIATRPKDQISGMFLHIAGGETLEIKETGCPPGTTVTIQDLFYNTPARRKFLKSTNTEFGQISDCIGRLSLARPDVAFTLRHPKNTVLQTPGRGRLLDAIAAVLGKTIARRLIAVSFSQGDMEVEGYISPPDLVRSSRHAETFIVNGRVVRSNLLSRAVSDGYHTLIPNRLYPIVVLNIKIPPKEYDVNVHPTKMEIRFHKEKILADFITEGVRKAVLGAKPLASFEGKSFTANRYIASDSSKEDSKFNAYEGVNFSKTKPVQNAQKSTQYAISFPEAKNTFTSPKEDRSLKTTSFDFLTPLSPSHDQKSTNLSPIEQGSLNNDDMKDHSNQVDPFRSDNMDHPIIQDNLENILADETYLKDQNSQLESIKLCETINDITLNRSSNELTSEESLLSLHPLGQIFHTYILATNGKELVIIDQHAAHERINYERLARQYQTSEVSSQELLIPIPMEFTLTEEEMLLEYILHLNKLGFILEEFGSHTYLLRGVPAYSGSYQGDELLRKFLDQVLEEKIPPTYEKLLEEWIYMLACKESIKAKESLSSLEMEQLIVRLSKTDNPYTCPHGRPTMIKLTQGELERRFYRT